MTSYPPCQWLITDHDVELSEQCGGGLQPRDEYQIAVSRRLVSQSHDVPCLTHTSHLKSIAI